jgi:cephalosporin-C deacetylase
MAFFDLSLEQLKEYKPKLYREKDFEAFWKKNLAQSKRQPLRPKLEKVNYPAKGVTCYKVFFDGFRNGRICGLYILPEGQTNLPVIVEFHGYNNRKREIFTILPWTYQGCAYLALDVRGQQGESTDGAVYPAPSGMPCLMKGVISPETYFYRYAYMDCVRAVGFLAGRKEIDSSRIALMGGSQGGGLTIAAAALCQEKIKLAVAQIPFLCNFPRNVEMAPDYPYPEICDFLRVHPHLKEQAFKTLSYFDGMNLAPDITAKTLVTAGLMDTICPPSSVYSAYNNMKCDKEIRVYEYLKHEVRDYMTEETFDWVLKNL